MSTHSQPSPKPVWYLALVVLLTLCLSLVISACGEATPLTAPTVASTSSSTAQNADTHAAVTVNMWTMPNTGQSVQDLQTALAEFYKANPDIKVNITEVSWSDAFGKISAALATGLGPDITQVGTTWVGTFANTGKLRPFTDAEIQTLGGSKTFNEGVWNTTHQVGSNNIVAIPWFAETRAIVYRTDVLKKAGLDASTAFKDWDSFVASLKQMKATEGDLVKAPFGITGQNDYNVVHNLMPWVWANGGNILSADNSKAVINSDVALKGVQFYTGLYNQDLTYKPAIDKSLDDLETMFRSGEVGSFISSPQIVIRSKHTKAQDSLGFADTVAGTNLGTAMLPVGPVGTHPFIGGSNLVVLKSSKNSDAAVKVVQYLASKQGQIAYQKLLGDLPTNIEAQSDPLFSDPLYKAYFDSLKVGYSYPEVPAWGAIEQDLQKACSSMWDDIVNGKGDAAIKTHLDVAAQEINQAIANSK